MSKDIFTNYAVMITTNVQIISNYVKIILLCAFDARKMLTL